MTSEDATATVGLPSDATPEGPLGAVIALSVVLSLGTLFLVAPLLWRILPVTPLPPPFPSHHQDAETLIFLLAFGILTPLGIVAGRRAAAAVAAGPNGASLSVLAASLSGGLALVVIVTRVTARASWGGGPAVLAVGAAVWMLVAAAALARARARGWPRLAAAADHTRHIWAAAALLLVPLALSFTELRDLSVPVLLIGGASAIVAGVRHRRVGRRRLMGWRGRAIDLGVVALLVLAIPNVFVVAAGDPSTALETSIVQFHQNFYLGPANQVLAGDSMLVEVISQYGVGSIYFLAAAFHVVPIGNGTLGLVEGGLSVLMFVGTFLVLRMAGASRLVASTTMGVAVVALVYGLLNPLGALLQHGAFRFGMPVGVLLGAVAEARWPHAARPARAFQLLVVAVAATWALEGFAYSLATAVVVAVVGAVTLERGRRRALARSLVELAAALVVGHVLFAGFTVARSGELPDWGWYLNTLREFLLGDIGNWTYDFSSFSPALAVAALYLMSAVAIVLVLLRRRDLHVPHRTLLIAIGGMTGYGIALFSYVVNRGADHIIPYVSLPVVALGALWLTFVDLPAVAAGASGRRAARVIAIGLATVLVAAAWTHVPDRYPQSALAHVVPGGPSLSSALDLLWDPPPLRSTAPEGEALLAEHLPGEARSMVLTSADLSVEILVRSGRGSSVPLGDPWEDSFVPDQHIAPLGEFVDGLRGGERALLDEPARLAFDAYRNDPSLDPLAGGGSTSIVPTELASLQEWVLQAIGQRFDLRTIALTESGLEVVELVPRPTAD
jgi:hypothetical protein